MRTTIDLSDDVLNEILEKSGANTKRGAIIVAINDYLKFKKIQELKNLIGNYDDFNLNLNDLKKIRMENGK